MATNVIGNPVRPSFVRRHRFKLLTIAALVVIGGLGSLYTFAALKFTYSTGERVGYVQKFSRRGWVCPTWEGELAMSPVPGAAPQIFEFSTRDPALAKRISESEGKRISLGYEQKKGLPSSCFGDTEYFVTGVRVVSN